MVIGDFNFSCHTAVYLLTGVKLIMEIPAVIFHHRITHILWKTIKIASTG